MILPTQRNTSFTISENKEPKNIVLIFIMKLQTFQPFVLIVLQVAIIEVTQFSRNHSSQLLFLE